MGAESIGIVGGAIGGIATAVALHQVGIDAVVYERAALLREVGVGMMLWPNATRVLRDMGLLEKVLARSGPNTHFLVRASCGKVLMNIALGNTWYATANVPSNQLDAPCGRKQELQSMFAGWHEPIADLIEATENDEILKNGARDFAPLRRWGDGMVTLLGDAAHPCTPNLGQGGCMALEDALVLAKCVDREASLHSALRRYESLRFHRTRGIQQRSLLMGHIGQWQNPLLVTGRRVVTRLLSPKLIERNLRHVYSYKT